MRYIDVHQHLLSEPGSLERLVKGYRESGIEKVCLSALGEQFGQPGNDAVEAAFAKYPSLILGFGYFRLGVDTPDLVDRLHKSGFKGLKVINPLDNYSSKKFYPVYEKAAKYKMPILFHTGSVNRQPRDAEFDVAPERMRPIYLDAIARAFPELNLIGAHLGGCWYQEACVAACHPNIYFDVSGFLNRVYNKDFSFFDHIVFWEGAKGHLVFGVDGHYHPEAEGCLAKHRRFLDTIGFTEEQKEQFFYGNMAKILGLKE